MKVERKEKEEEDAFALVFQKSSRVVCGANQNKLFSSLCDLTIDFCFFHHRACFFCFFVSPSFIFHRTLVFFCFITPEEITFARF